LEQGASIGVVKLFAVHLRLFCMFDSAADNDRIVRIGAEVHFRFLDELGSRLGQPSEMSAAGTQQGCSVGSAAVTDGGISAAAARAVVRHLDATAYKIGVHAPPPLTTAAHLVSISRSDASAIRSSSSCRLSTWRSMHPRTSSRSLAAGIASSSTDEPSNFFA